MLMQFFIYLIGFFLSIFFIYIIVRIVSVAIAKSYFEVKIESETKKEKKNEV